MKKKGQLNLNLEPAWPSMTLFVFVLLLFSGVSLSAQEPPLSRQDILDALTRHGYSSGEKDAFEALYLPLEQQNLPLAPLFRRWQQGAAKGVSSQQLLAVLGEEKQWLLEAGETLDLRGARLGLNRTSEYYLNRFLSLRRAGLSREDIRMLVDAAPDGVSLDRGSLLLLELDRWGLRGSPALSLVKALLAGPLPPGDFGYIIPLLQRGYSAGFDTDLLVGEIILYLPRSGDLLDLQEYLGF